jgi:methylase of polypeptide subunit release factors
MYADALRAQFPDLDPVVDDLFLLESHQIAGLPDRAPREALGVVLRARPDLARFLVARCQSIEPLVAGLVDGREPSGPEFSVAEDELVWEIADLIVYQRAPEMYDEAVRSGWGRSALAEIEPLEGKVIVDAGAGTGHVTFAVAAHAATVFAVEPVATLRDFIRDKAQRSALGNVHVIDGLLSAIPLPDDSADALITQRAIGWDFEAELDEIERIVRSGGVALHLLGDPYPAGEDALWHRELLAGGYEQASYGDGHSACRKYFKTI